MVHDVFTDGRSMAADDTYRTVTPYLVVRDGDEELRFLTAAFGGTDKESHRREDGTLMHAEITIGNSLVMLGQALQGMSPMPAALYLWVDDVDATYARALA